MSASCCGSSRKTAALVVMAATLGALIPVAVVVGVKAFREPPPAPPQIETVEVVVAVTELRTGTDFTHDNVARLTAIKTMPVAALPEDSKLVTSHAELVGKRLGRTAHRGEWLVADDVYRAKQQGMFEVFPDILTLAPKRGVDRTAIVSGSRVDVVAQYTRGDERNEFTLLPDMLVRAVNGVQAPPAGVQTSIGTSAEHVAFEVYPKQFPLLTLANQLNCDLAVVPRRPGDPRSAWYYDATLARLQRLAKELELAPSPRAVP